MSYLFRNPTFSGNRRTWTFSAWCKISAKTLQGLTVFGCFIDNAFNQGDDVQFRIGTGQGLRFSSINSQTGVGYTADIAQNNQGYHRDPSSWIHVVAVSDITNVDDDKDRWRMYVNGVRVTDTDNNTWPPSDVLTNINNTVLHYLGEPANTYTDGYISDAYFIDGLALEPSMFGFHKKDNGYVSSGSTLSTDFKPGQWVPKSPSSVKKDIENAGGFGVNGFYMPLNDSSNVGADFHTTPNSIIRLDEQLSQPKVSVCSTTKPGYAYTDILRNDPYANNLVLAIPFISSGLGTDGTVTGINTGFGDYSSYIKGSGSPKIGIVTSPSDVSIVNVSISDTSCVYYGSGVRFNGSGDFRISNNSDFNFDSGDFTIEFWARDTVDLNTQGDYITIWNNANNRESFLFGTSGAATRVILSSNGSAQETLASVAGILTHDQWNHHAFTKKGTTGRIFLNGSCVGVKTDFPSLVYNNTVDDLTIGGRGPNNATPAYFTGYMQDLRIYKGVAKYVEGFNVVNSYTPVGFGVSRVTVDNPLNNFAVANTVNAADNVSYSHAGLTISYDSSGSRGVSLATMGVATTEGIQKYYWEQHIDKSSTTPTNAFVGLFGVRYETKTANYPGFSQYGWGYYGNETASDGLYVNTTGSVVATSYGATYSQGDIIGVSLDMSTSNGSLTFYKNGVSQGVAVTGISTFISDGIVQALLPAWGDGAATATFTMSLNFGQNPSFSGNVAVAGTFTDANGEGLFKYQPPSGHLALCSKNLLSPTIKNPGKHVKTIFYRGDSRPYRNIVGIGFTPDLLIIKESQQSAGTSVFRIFDSIRGPKNVLIPNITSVELVRDEILSFNADGFSIGSEVGATNQDGSEFSAYCWRAGAGTTSTNTTGSTSSTISVNQDAGFSIVGYQGSGSVATIGHGLTSPPRFIIIKNRTVASNWPVFHKTLGSDKYLNLNLTAAASDSINIWNNTHPSGEVFTVGTASSVNTSGNDYIAYCWSEVEGYSKFGSYSGNANVDGRFCYCGFKPALIITGNDGNWLIYDGSHNYDNPASIYQIPNQNIANQDVGADIDILANGFKIRNTSVAGNATGVDKIFAAWAESPFKTSNIK